MTASNPTVGEPINPADKPGGAAYDGSKRPLYFTEQFLVVEDFKDDAYYHLGLAHRHNRYLHTPGVVAGLEVAIQAKPPASGDTQLTVGSGIALDNFGREIVLAAPATITFAAPAGTYERYVVISFKEEKSTDESDTKVPTGGRPGVKRAVQAPALRVTDTDPRIKWPRDLDDDPVLIGKLIRDSKSRVRVAPDQTGAGARISTTGALSFQQTIIDPADTNQRTAPPVQAGLDFADGALRIRARVSDPLSLDTTHLVIQQASGNVGIGTTNPTDKLTIRGGALAFQQANPDQSEMGIDYDAATQSLRIRARTGTATALSDDVLTINKDGELAAKAIRANSLQATGANDSLTLASAGTGTLLLNPAGGHLGIRTGPLNPANTADVVAAIETNALDTLKKATEGVLYAIKNEATPTPRLIITGDVIILGRLLVTHVSEYGGKVYRRGGQT